MSRRESPKTPSLHPRKIADTIIHRPAKIDWFQGPVPYLQNWARLSLRLCSHPNLLASSLRPGTAAPAGALPPNPGGRPLIEGQSANRPCVIPGAE